MVIPPVIPPNPMADFVLPEPPLAAQPLAACRLPSGFQRGRGRPRAPPRSNPRRRAALAEKHIYIYIHIYIYMYVCMYVCMYVMYTYIWETDQ